MNWNSVTAKPIDWDSEDWGGNVHVSSTGSYIGAEAG